MTVIADKKNDCLLDIIMPVPYQIFIGTKFYRVNIIDSKLAKMNTFPYIYNCKIKETYLPAINTFAQINKNEKSHQ